VRKVILYLITICTLLITCSFSVCADDVYVPSIEVKNDVVVIDGVVTDTNSYVTRVDPDGCVVYIVVTPYLYRNTIESQQSQEEIVLAYQDMNNSTSVEDMAPVVVEFADHLGLEDEDLIISNLFDVTLYVHEGGSHDETYDHQHIYNIKFTTEDLLNFVCLLHYDADNDLWEIVDGARITGENRDIVTFTWDCASPFAIVSKLKDGQKHDGGSSSEGSYNHGNYPIIYTGVDYGPVHKCIVDFNGHCYCLEIIVLLIVSIFFNVFFILKLNENKKHHKHDER